MNFIVLNTFLLNMIIYLLLYYNINFLLIIFVQNMENLINLFFLKLFIITNLTVLIYNKLIFDIIDITKLMFQL